MKTFVVRHRWKPDLTVISHTLITAENQDQAKRIADEKHPEHYNEVINNPA